jgi:enoyl-CoA hydratase
MGERRLSVSVEGAVAILRFSNPPHEFMDDVTVRQLAATLEELEHDAAVRAVVLTGTSEDVFIRHYDVHELEQRGRKLAARGLTFSLDQLVPENAIHACYRRIEQSAKPFIAAVNGTAMGGGFELALSCDIRLLRDGAYDLGLPEINIGLLPGGGGTQRLVRLAGQARALELMLLGKTFTPQQAVGYGLASECVSGAIMPRALEIAHELAAKPATAVAHIKRLVRGSFGSDPGAGFAAERTLFCDLMVSDESIKRMHAMNTGHRDLRDRQPPLPS